MKKRPANFSLLLCLIFFCKNNYIFICLGKFVNVRWIITPFPSPSPFPNLTGKTKIFANTKSCLFVLKIFHFYFLSLVGPQRTTVQNTGLGICSSLICSVTQIPQDKSVNMSHLLRLLRKNEQMWAIPSGHSGQMSDCERIAQDKWANVSNLLRLLSTKEWISKLLTKNEQLAQKIWINSYFLQTPKARSDHLILTVSEYLIELFETLLETGIIL